MAAADDTTEEDPSPYDRWDAPDPMLQFLVRLINRTGEGGGKAGITMTITTPAGLISGYLCSRREWFELQAAAFRNMGEVGEALGDSLDQLVGEPNLDADQPSEKTTYIHLRDAHFYIGGQLMIGGEATLWRGRLSEVSGFTVGVLKES